MLEVEAICRLSTCKWRRQFQYRYTYCSLVQTSFLAHRWLLLQETMVFLKYNTLWTKKWKEYSWEYVKFDNKTEIETRLSWPLLVFKVRGVWSRIKGIWTKSLEKIQFGIGKTKQRCSTHHFSSSKEHLFVVLRSRARNKILDKLFWIFLHFSFVVDKIETRLSWALLVFKVRGVWSRIKGIWTKSLEKIQFGMGKAKQTCSTHHFSSSKENLFVVQSTKQDFGQNSFEYFYISALSLLVRFL